MGSMTAPDEFLSEAILTRKPGYGTMARLARMQILTGNRTGHILHLNTEHLRRCIQRHARHGSVPTQVVHCSRCGCMAYISDWLKAADGTAQDCARLHAALLPDNPPWRLEFLVRCKGNRTARGTLHIVDSAIAGKW